MTLDIGTSNDKDEERKRETEIKRSTRLHSNRERGVINAATIGSASTSRMTLRGGEISDDTILSSIPWKTEEFARKAAIIQ